MSSTRRLPQATQYQELRPFVSDFLKELKAVLNSENFLRVLKHIDIRSRATFFSLVRRQREVSHEQLNRIIHTFDFSRQDQQHLQQLKQAGTAPASTTTEKILVRPEVLSHPLFTIILNICALDTKQNREQIEHQLKTLAPAEDITRAVNLLIEENLLAVDSDGFLRRIDFRVLSTMPGIKSSHSQKYISASLQMAEEKYALELSEREYVSFTSRIAAKDMGQLKDLIRQFREDVYALRSQDRCDTVMQINLNAFTVYKDLT